MELLLKTMMFILSTAMFIAAWQGIDYGLQLNFIITSLIALLLLNFPVILAVVAVYGAVNAWGLPIWGAILLVMWPLVLTIIMNGFSSILSLYTLKKSDEHDT